MRIRLVASVALFAPVTVFAHDIPGVGGISHLTLEMFKAGAKISIENVSYKGTGPALADLFVGPVPLLISDLPAPLPHVNSGQGREEFTRWTQADVELNP